MKVQCDLHYQGEDTNFINENQPCLNGRILFTK